MIREVKSRLQYTEEDYQLRLRNIMHFLNEGNQVKAIMMFRHREIAHKEIAEDMFRRLVAELMDYATAQLPPVMDDRQMFVLFTPRVVK